MAEGGGPACGEGHQPPPQVMQQQQLHMNWSHFKPEFSGKPDEDVEAHLLRTNDWMTFLNLNIHNSFFYLSDLLHFYIDYRSIPCKYVYKKS